MSSSSGSIGRSIANKAVSATADSGALVRVVSLSPGQQVQATVVEIAEQGRVVIGLLGGRVAAFSKLPLELGKSYEFTVAAVQPKIVLSTAKPVVLPDFAAAAARGRLGPAPAALDAWLRTAGAALGVDLTRLPATVEGFGRSPDPSGGDAALAGSAHFAAESAALADALQGLERRLGHDLEARVLRLGHAPESRLAHLAAELRDTLKSRAIAYLERVATAAGDSDVDGETQRALRELVGGLNAIETDNARRADQGGASWLPLPTMGERGELRDARMFLLHRDADDVDRGAPDVAQRAFTIVLLLDLTRLGALRVDLGLRDARLTVDVETVEPAAASAVRGAIAQLGDDLERAGLTVDRLAVRVAPGRQLKVADLLSPAPRGEAFGTNLIDVHA